ncbi:MAG: DUF948 domain-containing protein [Alkalispirochaeta sp.]
MKERSRRLQATITLAFAVLVFATALVMALISYAFTAQAVRQTSRDYTVQLIDQVHEGIDSYITHMESIAEVVQLNERVQEYLGRTGPVRSCLPWQRSTGVGSRRFSTRSPGREMTSLLF